MSYGDSVDTLNSLDPKATVVDSWDAQAPYEPANGVEPYSARRDDDDSATTIRPFEHFEAEVIKLGGPNHLLARETPPDFRARLADEVLASKDPVHRIHAVVRHCISRPSQDKIEDGADVLSGLGERFVSLVERLEEDYSPAQLDDCIWLYTTAMCYAKDVGAGSRDRLIRKLCEWLRRYDDPSIRENVADALGSMGAVDARDVLIEIRDKERDSMAREAIEDALDELGS